MQELAHVVLTGMRRRRPDMNIETQLELLAKLMSSTPAALFRINHRKGSVEIGKDADFAVIDPHAIWMLNGQNVQSKVGWSAYEGFTMTGRVEATIRRGENIWTRDGAIFGSPTGEWLDAVPTFQ